MEYKIKSLDGKGLGGYIINNINQLDLNMVSVYAITLEEDELKIALRFIIGIANFWEDFHKYDVYAMQKAVGIIKKEIDNRKGKSLIK